MKHLRIAFLATALLLLGLSCAPSSDNASTASLTAEEITIRVSYDELFHLGDGAPIGKIWFSQTYGPIGTTVIIVPKLSSKFSVKTSFTGKTFLGTVKLLNPQLTTYNDYEIDFEHEYDAYDQESEGHNQIKLLIPQVTTIPSILSFDVTLELYDPDTSELKFQAFCTYEFVVDEGRPAIL